MIRTLTAPWELAKLPSMVKTDTSLLQVSLGTKIKSPNSAPRWPRFAAITKKLQAAGFAADVPGGPSIRKRRRLSAAARKRIAAAQKERWAAFRKQRIDGK